MTPETTRSTPIILTVVRINDVQLYLEKCPETRNDLKPSRKAIRPNFMRLAIGLLAFIAAISVSAQSVAPTSAQRDFAKARDIIVQGMNKDSVRGLAIAVAHGDTVLWEEAFGWADRDARIAVTLTTPFYTASVTKTIAKKVSSASIAPRMIISERRRCGVRSGMLAPSPRVSCSIKHRD